MQVKETTMVEMHEPDEDEKRVINITSNEGDFSNGMQGDSSGTHQLNRTREDKHNHAKKKVLVHKKMKKSNTRLRIEPVDSVEVIRKREFMPVLIGSGNSSKLLLVSPSRKRQFQNRQYSASVEVFGTPRSTRPTSSNYRPLWSASENRFPKKTNLGDRKKEVLRIAAENFKIVQRLQRV